MTAAVSDFSDYKPATDNRTAAELVDAGEIDAPDDWNTYPSPGLPMATARRLMADVFSINGKRALAFWRGGWWLWGGASWHPAEDDLEIKDHIWHRLEQATYMDKDDAPKPWAPTTAKVHNVMEPLAIRSRIPGHVDAPAWLDDGGNRPPAGRIIPMSNGLLDLKTGNVLAHDPALFATWHLPFDYDPNATCPTWARFLGDVFAHDPAGELLLQEYAGYLISGRTDQHKALLIVGPRRGGKGTISRTIQRLVGTGNTVSPTLGTLGGEFGLADLIGKPLAVIEDARADDDRRNNTTVERLLNIIGEDAVSINRKNRDYWNGTLPTRFMLVSNETPRFLDASGAITSRFMSVRLKQSFEANPDTTLGTRIAGELPGIFNWAVEGLRRLEQQGHFTRPATMDEMHDLMTDMASPMARFLEERYTVTGNDDDAIPVTDVFGVYKQWAENQQMLTMTRDVFIQRVLAASPAVSFKNTRINGGPKNRWFFGLRAQAWEFPQ